MRRITSIVVHCSASGFGDVSLIRDWHIRERKWKDIGYHYVILNGKRGGEVSYRKSVDGLLEVGRGEDEVGAHVQGMNRNSIGICLVGLDTFTPSQLQTLSDLVRSLMRKYKLGIDDIYGHYEFDKRKSCPNMDMNILRAALSKEPLKDGGKKG